MPLLSVPEVSHYRKNDIGVDSLVAIKVFLMNRVGGKLSILLASYPSKLAQL